MVGRSPSGSRRAYDRYQATAPDPKAVRAAPSGGAVRYVLPAHSLAASDAVKLPATSAGVVTAKAFKPDPPGPGLSEHLIEQLTNPLHRDAASARITPLPLPFADLDTVRVHFPDKVQQGFPGTLGLAENGILEATGPLPDTLLATRVVQGVTQLGELDRTLLRAPVAKWKGAAHPKRRPPGHTAASARPRASRAERTPAG